MSARDPMARERRGMSAPVHKMQNDDAMLPPIVPASSPMPIAQAQPSIDRYLRWVAQQRMVDRLYREQRNRGG